MTFKYFTIIVEHEESGKTVISRWHEMYNSLAVAKTRAREFAHELNGRVIRVTMVRA
jgi:hypothetical protein